MAMVFPATRVEVGYTEPYHPTTVDKIGCVLIFGFGVFVMLFLLALILYDYHLRRRR